MSPGGVVQPSGAQSGPLPSLQLPYIPPKKGAMLINHPSYHQRTWATGPKLGGLGRRAWDKGHGTGNGPGGLGQWGTGTGAQGPDQRARAGGSAPESPRGTMSCRMQRMAVCKTPRGPGPVDLSQGTGLIYSHVYVTTNRVACLQLKIIN